MTSFGRVVDELIDQDNLSITHICSQLNMSRSQVHRKIKANTGASTSIYIRTLKLDKACKLLRESDMTIARVAHICGIHNPQNMSKYFSNVYGITPTQYRLQSQ